MPLYSYKAIQKNGRYTQGKIDAADPNSARQKLRQQGLNPIDLTTPKAKSSPQGFNKSSPRKPQKKVDLQKVKLSRAKADSISLSFLEKLHELVKSGLPLGDAIKSLNQRLSDPTLSAVADIVWRDLSEGGTLGEAVRRRPEIFDSSLAAMIDVGEATGNLGPILENIVELLRTKIALRKNIITGLSYPAFVLSIVFALLLFVLFYLMPLVQEMMESMGAELSLAAWLITAMAGAAITYGPFVIFGLGILALIIQKWRKTEEGKLKSDQILLSIPVIKDVVLNAELSRFSNLASILMGSGVDATDALKLLEKGFKNEELKQRFHISRGMINDGSSFAEAFQEQGLLIDMDADVLSISENTGSMVNGFNSIYQTRHENLESQMKKLTAVLSTGSIFFVFFLIFLLAIGIVQSIMQLSTTIIGA